MAISDELRKAIRDAVDRGDFPSIRALANAAKTAPIVVWRFLNAERSLTCHVIDRLADTLKLELKRKR